uniref:Uncharacterized protein n=1 Tax=Romanomermis culicivorax TaxID=13658 RepID=A0A915JYV5_ROMCU
MTRKSNLNADLVAVEMRKNSKKKSF